MEGTARRPRYVKYGNRPGRMRSSIRGRLAKKIFRDAVICFLLFCILWLAGSIKTPARDIFVGYVRDVLRANITFNGIYSTIDRCVNSLKKINIQNLFGQESATAVTQSETADGNATTDEAIYAQIKARITPPFPEGQVVSGYGERINPLSGEVEFHKGIDIEPGPEKTVKAVLGGKVMETGNSKDYGKYVSIGDSDGNTVIYGNCSMILVSPGENVEKGEVVADVGTAVDGVGTHLHLEVWRDGKHLNPEKLFDF